MTCHKWSKNWKTGKNRRSNKVRRYACDTRGSFSNLSHLQKFRLSETYSDLQNIIFYEVTCTVQYKLLVVCTSQYKLLQCREILAFLWQLKIRLIFQVKQKKVLNDSDKEIIENLIFASDCTVYSRRSSKLLFQHFLSLIVRNTSFHSMQRYLNIHHTHDNY